MIQTGRKLASLRIGANLSQEQLAEKLYVSRDLVAKWETGARRISYRYLLSLSELFGVDVEELAPKNEVLAGELSGCLPEGIDLSPRELEIHLNDFLSELDPRKSGLFVKRYYYMEEIAAISEATGLKENHVRTLLSRTRKKLKRYLKEVT